jgi:hypothetical protein
MKRKYTTIQSRQGIIELYLDIVTGTIMFFGVVLFFSLLFKIIIDNNNI